MTPTPELGNVIGLVKSAIGDCVDKLPHDEIRKKLWEAVEVLHEVARLADEEPKCR